MISDSRFLLRITGLAAAKTCGRFEAEVALLITQAQLVLGALGQAVVGQLQFAHFHALQLLAIHAQQRVTDARDHFHLNYLSFPQ